MFVQSGVTGEWRKKARQRWATHPTYRGDASPGKHLLLCVLVLVCVCVTVISTVEVAIKKHAKNIHKHSCNHPFDKISL